MRERRFVKGTEVRVVAESGHIDGHAAVFGETYVLMDYPDFRVEESIAPGAFARAIKEKQDVRALFNHDASLLLGRTSAGTLDLKEDRQGLYFDNSPPDTQVGRDVRTLIDRGDITGCSFAFQVTKQTRTEETVDGQLIVSRIIQDVDLFDVGPVTYPAYEGTDVNARQVDYRGLFPNGYPEPMRKHLGDLGLPPDLSRRRTVKSKKRQVTLDMTSEEIQSMMDDMETQMTNMQASMDAMKMSCDTMEEKLLGAQADKGEAEQNAAKWQAKAEQANDELVGARQAFKEEKAGVAAWVKRVNEDVLAIVAASRSGLSEVKKRAMAATVMQANLKQSAERLLALEKTVGEERALLASLETLPEWTAAIGMLQESAKRENEGVVRIQQRAGALAVIEERTTSLVDGFTQQRTAMQAEVQLPDFAATPVNQLSEAIKRAGEVIAKFQQRCTALVSLEQCLIALAASLKDERSLLLSAPALPEWNPVLTQLRDSVKRDADVMQKLAQRRSALVKLEKQLGEERAALQAVQEVDPNWRVFADELEKVLQQSEEAVRELTRRTRLWE